jgi:hypothetical protein
MAETHHKHYHISYAFATVRPCWLWADAHTLEGKRQSVVAFFETIRYDISNNSRELWAEVVGKLTPKFPGLGSN